MNFNFLFSSYIVIAFLALSILMSCSLGSEENSNQVNVSMISVKESNQYFLVGGTFKVKLNYPFEISQKEISLEEYNKVLDYNPIPESLKNEYQSDFPVTHVSYFDAIRFCNALSRQHNLDTVYTYTTLSLTELGSVISIEGLVVDYSKNGFRLPTEPEWEYSATQGNTQLYPWGSDSKLATQYAWYANNSNESLHLPCTKSLTNSNLCDLAGNALEWVDGFLTDLPTSDSSINFIGTQMAPTDPQRIVKGGSYETALSSLEIMQRKDVYSVYSETKTKYIGFRIAKGIIPSPQSLNGSSIGTISGTPIKLVASKEQIQNFFKSTNVKLTMINGSNEYLNTLDFSQSSPQIKEWLQLQVRHPSLSPNGMRIVMGTVSEGQSSTGKILLSTFNNPIQIDTLPFNGAIPRFWVSPMQKDTFIISSSTAKPNSDSLSWSLDKTYITRYCKSSNCNIQPSIWFEQGGFHDGISKSGRYAITSYQELRVLDRDSNTIKTFFKSPNNGKSSKASSQACNASIGGIHEYILFLDFGSKETSSIVGRSYGIHEFLFLMDPTTGQIKDTILVPKPWKAWNHSEWSNHPYYAIATVTDASEQNRAIYAIRFPDHAVLKIAEGEDIISPHLWVNDTYTLTKSEEDSLFEYATPKTEYNHYSSIQLYQSILIRDEIQTLILGSSRTLDGVNPCWLKENCSNTYNLSIPSMDPWTMSILLRDYGHFYPNIKNLVIEFSLEFFLKQPEEISTKLLTMSNGYIYDKKNAFWNYKFDTRQSSAIAAKRNSHPLYNKISDQGYEAIPSQNWGGTDLPNSFIEESDLWKLAFQDLFNVLTPYINSGINILFVITPQNPEYRKIGYVGRYGVTLKLGQEMLDSLNHRIIKHSNIQLLDEHKFGLHDYVDSMAYNYDHLSTYGAFQLSTRIKSQLEIMNK